ncbi:MAG: 50S ribosomal protein L10, partial [Candidatus Thermoplasmatota archaeon]|nr:50S ribosomal protein L10 [Candidatus Thermoplasmatota archaeon]
RTEKIPEKKKKALADLVDNINKNSTVMIVSIENISTLQFLQIKRAIKDLAVVKVLKKNVIIRALENLKDNKKGQDVKP